MTLRRLQSQNKLVTLRGAVLAVALFALARSFQEGGHPWGDDYALYINQARGLADGTLWNVVADNRFALSNSAWSTFSPIAYPWGFPLLLFPLVSIFGLNFGVLKLVPTIAYVAMSLLMLGLTRRRFDRVGSTLVTLIVALNSWFISSTDAVLSDIVFIAIALGSLSLIDAAWRHNRVLIRNDRLMVAAAVTMGFAFHVRREGLGLFLALAAIQLVASRATGTHRPSRPSIVIPWLWLFATVIGVHLILPAPLLATRAPGGGLRAIPSNLQWYAPRFAELLGLKTAGNEPISLLSSHLLGVVLAWTVAIAGVIGLVASLIGLFRRQSSAPIHIAAAAIGIGALVLITPYHEQRHMYTPFVLLLIIAAYGLHTLGALTGRHLASSIAICLVFIGPACGTLQMTASSLRYHVDYDYVHWGPEDPAVAELFDAITRLTDERDVVVFFQARSMNLFTHRRAIQGNNVDMMVDRGDWYAQEIGSDYIQSPLTESEAASIGFRESWRNSKFILWQITNR